jgi:hypothetical protein
LGSETKLHTSCLILRTSCIHECTPYCSWILCYTPHGTCDVANFLTGKGLRTKITILSDVRDQRDTTTTWEQIANHPVYRTMCLHIQVGCEAVLSSWQRRHTYGSLLSNRATTPSSADHMQSSKPCQEQTRDDTRNRSRQHQPRNFLVAEVGCQALPYFLAYACEFFAGLVLYKRRDLEPRSSIRFRCLQSHTTVTRVGGVPRSQVLAGGLSGWGCGRERVL